MLLFRQKDLGENKTPGTQDSVGLSRVAWSVAAKSLLFVLLSLILFLLTSRDVVVYDEGLWLTGAMRVMAGQVPHRDFYFNYGAGTLYLLAGLFRLFGSSVFVERLAGVVVSSLLVLSVFSLARRYCGREVALLTTFVAWLWVAMDLIQGIGPPLVCLPILWSTWLVVPAASASAQRRTFGAGLLVGMLFLFRYDLGVGIACAHLVTIALLALLSEVQTSDRVRQMREVMWPYATGFALMVTGPAVAYLRVAPIHDVLYDVFLFQAKYYRMGRALPFPRVSFDTLPDCVVYVAPLVIGLALYFITREFWRHRHSERPAALPGWVQLLVGYGIIAAMIYVKGTVRTSAGQMFPCTILCLMMLALIGEQVRRSSVGWQTLCCVLGVILAILGASGLQMKLLAEKHTRSSTLKWIVAPARQPPFPPFRSWCEDGAPITTGFCYLLDEDRIEVVRYVRSHTRPEDTLYVGLLHHDRVFVNDNITYYATQRLPATKWSHFDPFLQNRADIQQQMIGELERNRPPYIVLDAEFEGSHEPNGSSVSTGVYLLDDYIAAHYSAAAKFGELTVAKRRDDSN